MSHFRNIFNRSYSKVFSLGSVITVTASHYYTNDGSILLESKCSTNSRHLPPSNSISKTEQNYQSNTLNLIETSSKYTNSNNNQDTDLKKLFNDFVIISGSSSVELTNKICKILGKPIVYYIAVFENILMNVR